MPKFRNFSQKAAKNAKKPLKKCKKSFQNKSSGRQASTLSGKVKIDFLDTKLSLSDEQFVNCGKNAENFNRFSTGMKNGLKTMSKNCAKP